MDNFRQMLLELPFVRERADGTLDYWSVAETGDRAADMDLGRGYAARLLQFYRATGGVHVSAHVLEAWFETRAQTRGYVREGFGYEVAATLFKAPASATPGLALAQATMPGGFALHACPFAERSADGSLDCWAVSPTADWSRDCATGRYYGALCAHAARRLKDPFALGPVLDSMFSDEDRFRASRGLWTGWIAEIVEITAASCPRATRHQRAALAFMGGD